jgi:hypothetical protein
MNSALKRKISTALSAGLALSGLGLTGCVYDARPRREVVVVQADPAPAPVVEADVAPPQDQDESAYIGYPPYSDAVWIRGHYVWLEGQGCWAWRRGHWARAPHYGAVWIAGHYDHRVWIEGYWR